MKSALMALIILAVAIIASGCTGGMQAPASAGAPADARQASFAGAALPADLTGSWTLDTMGIQGGTQIINPIAVITLTINPDGTLYGFDGCNNYDGRVSLTGTATPDGTGITVGPVDRSALACANLNDEEQFYLDILGRSGAYAINPGKLTLTAGNGDVLIYVPTAVAQQTTILPPPY